MLKKIKWQLSMIVILAALLFMSAVCYAIETDDTDKSSSSDSTTELSNGVVVPNDDADVGATEEDEEEDEEDEDDDDDGWGAVQALLDKLGEIVKGIGRIFTDGVGWLIEITLGKWFESFYIKLASGLSNWLLTTPVLINFEFIMKAWFLLWGCSTILLAIGAGTCVKKLLTGSVTAGYILKVLAVGFILSSSALYLADLSAWGQNQVWNIISKQSLEKVFEENETNAAYIGKIDMSTGTRMQVNKEDIKFANVDGDTLFKLAFATDESKRQQVLNGTPFYTLFLSETTAADGTVVESNMSGGGLVMMIWIMVLMIILGLFGLVRFYSYTFLALSGTCYVSGATFLGKIEPMVGWANLTFRTLLLQSIIDGAWFIMIVSQDFVRELGFDPLIFNAVILTVAIALSWYFWCTWLKMSLKTPFTLAGGAVIKSFGTAGAAVGEVLDAVGERYGMEKLQDFSHSLRSGSSKISSKGGELLKSGTKMASKDITGSSSYADNLIKIMGKASDLIQERTDYNSKEVYKKSEVKTLNEEVSWDALNVTDNAGNNFSVVETREILKHLRHKGFKEDTLKLSGSKFLVSSEHAKSAIEDIRSYLDSEKISGSISRAEGIAKEQGQRNYVRFKTDIDRSELENIKKSIDKKLPRGGCSINENGNGFLAPVEHAETVEKIIKNYQKNKKRYWINPDDNSYACYDDQLKAFVKYKTPPTNGLNMGNKK